MLYKKPQHPYTEALLSAVPIHNDFHPRCHYIEDKCANEEPSLRPINEGHFAACHYSEQLDLRDVVETEDIDFDPEVH